MTIVINVQAIRHSRWRMYSAALKDFAISINVPCPSVATSSFPFNGLARDVKMASALLTAWTVSQLCPCGCWTQWDPSGYNPPPSPQPPPNTFPPLSCSVLLWVTWACVQLCAPEIVFFRRRGKANSKVGFPIGEAPFLRRELRRRSLKIWNYLCACFIKVKVLCRTQKQPIDWEWISLFSYFAEL